MQSLITGTLKTIQSLADFSRRSRRKTRKCGTPGAAPIQPENGQALAESIVSSEEVKTTYSGISVFSVDVCGTGEDVNGGSAIS